MTNIEEFIDTCILDIHVFKNNAIKKHMDALKLSTSNYTIMVEDKDTEHVLYVVNKEAHYAFSFVTVVEGATIKCHIKLLDYDNSFIQKAKQKLKNVLRTKQRG